MNFPRAHNSCNCCGDLRVKEEKVDSDLEAHHFYLMEDKLQCYVCSFAIYLIKILIHRNNLFYSSITLNVGGQINFSCYLRHNENVWSTREDKKLIPFWSNFIPSIKEPHCLSHVPISLGGSIPENNECCWPCHLFNIEICELQIEQCSTAIEILSLIMWKLLCITLEILRDDVVNDNGNAGVVSHLFPLVFMGTKHWLTPLESKAWLPLTPQPQRVANCWIPSNGNTLSRMLASSHRSCCKDITSHAGKPTEFVPSTLTYLCMEVKKGKHACALGKKAWHDELLTLFVASKFLQKFVP